jgi:hypothetical protein
MSLREVLSRLQRKSPSPVRLGGRARLELPQPKLPSLGIWGRSSTLAPTTTIAAYWLRVPAVFVRSSPRGSKQIPRRASFGSSNAREGLPRLGVALLVASITALCAVDHVNVNGSATLDRWL